MIRAADDSRERVAIRDARLNRASTHVICGWPGCPGRLGAWRVEPHPTGGDSVTVVIVPEGMSLDRGIGAYRLSNGAKSRLGGMPVDPVTGEPNVWDPTRYRTGEPARRMLASCLPVYRISDTGDQVRALFRRSFGPASVAGNKPHDVNKIGEQAVPPFEIVCPRCNRRNRVPLDIGNTAR